MSITRFAYCILLATFVFVVGCASPKSTPDPLVGWNFCVSQDPGRLDKAIRDDYQDYIQKLPPKEKADVGIIDLLEDKTGQHAVRIEISGYACWYHILFYDKDNKRVKVIKYYVGRYMS
jgi:hypothetical protein